jgi:hypothetical protein
MNKNLSFKVTVEYYCNNMVSVEELKTEFENNPLKAYQFISDDFKDSASSFAETEKVIKVEIITNPLNSKN